MSRLSRIGPVALSLVTRPNRAEASALVRDGRVRLAALMRQAVKLARSIYRQGRAGKAWAWCMAIGLRSAWARAKAELTASLAPMPVRVPVPVLRPVERRPTPIAVRTFDRGSRIHSHGW